MPASGRGANLDTSRRITTVRKPPPPAPTLRQQAAATNLRSTSLSSEPFKPAQQQAQRKVVATQKALPPEHVPHIPFIPNPTPAQTHAVKLIAQEHANASGHAPTYWKALANDPRPEAQRYIALIKHYIRAAQGHEAATAGRHVDPSLATAARGEAVAIGRRLLAQVDPATAGVAPPGSVQGTGLLATVHNYLGERVAEDVPALAKAGRAIATLATGQVAGPHGLAGNALADFANLGRAPLIGGVEGAKAVLPLLPFLAGAHGDVKPAKQFASNVAKGIEQGAVSKLVQGDPSAALRALKEHPLFTLTEAAGLEGAAGRTLGAAARTLGGTEADAGASGALARLGSQTRAPLALSQDAGAAKQGLVKERGRSKDVIRGAIQDLVDAKTRKPVIDPATGEAVTYTKNGRTRNVLAPRSSGNREGIRSHFPSEEQRLQRHRANEEQGKERDKELYERDLATLKEHEASRRKITVAGKTIKTPLPKAGGRLETDIAHGFAEGVFRTAKKLKGDMQKRVEHLQRQIQISKEAEAAGNKFGPYNTRKEREVAEHQVDTFTKALNNPKVMARAERIAEVGHAYAKHANAFDVIQQELGIYSPYEIRQSRLRTYALAHMDAKHHTAENHAAAEQAVKDASGTLEEQLAVSGRDPALVARHEAAKAAVGIARRRVSTAEKALARATTDEERKAAKAKLNEAKKAHTQAKEAIPAKPPRRAGLRNADGTFLALEDIEAHARKAGRNPDTLAYFPHKQGGIGKGAYHKQPRMGSRPISPGHTNTGALFQRGNHAIGREVVNDEFHNKATTISRVMAHDQFFGETALKHPQYEEMRAKARAGGKLTKQQQRIVAAKGLMTPQEALTVAKRLTEEGHDYRAFKAFPAKLSEVDKENLLANHDPAAVESVHHRLLSERLIDESDHSHARNAAVVPGHIYDRHEQLVEPAGRAVRAYQLIGKVFRTAVLAQPKWLTGDFVEPQFVRLPLRGAGLVNVFGMGLDIHAGRKLIRGMLASDDPRVKAAGHEFAASVHASIGVTGRDNSIRRTYEDFPKGTWLHGSLKVGHDFRQLPVIKTMADLTLMIPRTFFGVNSRIGRLAKQQALGKNVRMDIQEHTGSWMKSITLADKAMEDVRKGLINTPAQVRYAEQEIAMLGRYNGYGPVMKTLTQTATPFIPWVLNSLRFVYWTLPAHHSTTFLALQKESQQVLKHWEEEHSDLPPGELRDSLKMKDGGAIPISKYLPTGATLGISEALLNPTDKKSVKGGLRSLTGSINPQFSSIQGALEGEDFLGEELQRPPSASNPEGQANLLDFIKAAANATGGVTVPNWNLAGSLLAQGGTPYSGVTVPEQALRAFKGEAPLDKPGSKHTSTLNRGLNPLREVYVHPQEAPASEPPKGVPGTKGSLSLRQQAAAARGSLRSSSGPSLRQEAARERLRR